MGGYKFRSNTVKRKKSLPRFEDNNDAQFTLKINISGT